MGRAFEEDDIEPELIDSTDDGEEDEEIDEDLL